MLVTIGLVLGMLASFGNALALTLEAFDINRTYYVQDVEFTGNRAISTAELDNVIQTHPRPLLQSWKFWQKPPLFDPETFKSDLDRLKRFYENQGYYDVRVSYDLSLGKNNMVTAMIHIDEGPVVKVARLRIIVDGADLSVSSPLYRQIPLQPGARFTVGDYEKGQERLRAFYMDAGYAQTKVQRRAEVDTVRQQADVTYTVRPGRQAVFGSTVVKGTKDVSPGLILRELTYKQGEIFSLRKIDESRSRIIALGLFSVVQFKEQTHGESGVIPIVIQVQERKARLISLGGGYNTISQFIANAQWQDLNFMGGGRQLIVSALYSSINSALAASLVQPEFLVSQMEGSLNGSQNIQQLPSYNLFASEFRPLLTYHFSPQLTVSGGYRFEYGKLNSVDPTLIEALGGIKNSGIVSGPVANLTLNTSNDPYNPSAGNVLYLDAMESGGIFGGNFSFYRLVMEGKHYQEIGWKTIFASRLKIGLADTISGPKDNYPLFFRFFSGGEGSVRGYKYWGIGPRSANNTPLGGLSLIEGSLELRRPLWRSLGGVIFLDFGQLSTNAYKLRVGSLQYGSGLGITYATPVGPVAFDIGFPLVTPPGDQSWQLYFSVGQYF